MKMRPQLQLFAPDNDNADPAPLRVWVDPDEPDADNFAGGGGASLGISQAYEELGIERRAPTIAVNHWAEALAMYEANNPRCRVFCEDILKVDPVVASGGKRIAYCHSSPTCIFFSQAAGAALDAEEATKVRALANVLITWAESAVRPRVMSMENVKQFMKWGPPIGTITQRDHHSVAMLNLLKLRGTSDAHVAASAQAVDDPLDTISASGTHFAAQAAYLIRYNGESGPESLAKPLSTIDTRDRFALVTLTMELEVSERAMRVARFLGYDAPIVLEIDGVQWILVDIGFRMLTARELFLCQGFPPSYKIELLFRGKPLTKTAQIKCVGNSVPPQLARAVGMAAIRTIEYARAA